MNNLSKNEKLCDRCKGAKFMYKLGSGYTTCSTIGGKKSDCPQCAGKGFVKTLEAALAELDEVKQPEVKQPEVRVYVPAASDNANKKRGRPHKQVLAVSGV
jgi:hypothetical protein